VVLAGTRDLIRDAHTRLIARSLPNATLIILPGSHSLVTEEPDAYRDAVLAWFRKIGAVQGA
jgi:pimeloyl-ACP methyl ester carboxylesterase